MFLNAIAGRRYGSGNLHRYLALSRPRLALPTGRHLQTTRRLLHESRTLGESNTTLDPDEDVDKVIESRNRHPDHVAVQKEEQDENRGGQMRDLKFPQVLEPSHIQSTQFVHELDEYKKYFHFPAGAKKSDIAQLTVGDQVTIHGFLSARRTKHSRLVFTDVTSDYVPVVQVTSSIEGTKGLDGQDRALAAHRDLRSVPLHTPVAVTGLVTRIHRLGERAKVGANLKADRIERLDLNLKSIQVLNPFPKDIIVSQGVKFPPTARHLQIRFDQALRARLMFRSDVMRLFRGSLRTVGFRDMETPLLFKSTPEGAREFIVPTRRKGLVYALPQSPQQYKQLLMASGIYRYFQFAKCFRDEDLRSDRQPEFTQLDLEMAFVTGEDVMQTVENMIKTFLRNLKSRYTMTEMDGEMVPVLSPPGPQTSTNKGFPDFWEEQPTSFPRITYQEAMAKYGSDKPDLRIPFDIHNIDPSILPETFISMITDLPSPAIDVLKVRLPDTSGSVTTEEKRAHIHSFMDHPPPPALYYNPDGAPAVLVIDSSKPLNGLSSLGHEGAANLTALPAFSDLEDGDILILQARPGRPFHGGSTPIGNMRIALYNDCIAREILPKDDSFKFLWVTDFPMFTPDTDIAADEGQGGKAGFSATHHPFTAPLTDADFDLMTTDPLKAKADHYDLVVNGIELGGGSRRIHVAKVQEYVMRDILKMTDEGVAQFAHLLEALRAGCPPHAGFALGFDRFVAVISGTNSVRDVIAFPKSMKGADLLVKSPSKITNAQLDRYHLRLRWRGKGEVREKREEGEEGEEEQEEEMEEEEEEEEEGGYERGSIR